MVLSLLQRI
ncbi:hypothetical protein E2C01_085056 [Portunus trituberculatus]|uniref:Uncharacterized protein n=1 Tax=Portunus trituberculatus TaxID=210409 RepID=A0A5B7J5R7_PORTR|nr:hypothetical protein [Portunus trituberculatus]